MRTVQLTLDEDLLKQVDRLVRSCGTTRSAFTRDALRAALQRRMEKEMEKKHLEGYRRKPVRPQEFKIWEGEQVWGDK